MKNLTLAVYAASICLSSGAMADQTTTYFKVTGAENARLESGALSADQQAELTQALTVEFESAVSEKQIAWELQATPENPLNIQIVQASATGKGFEYENGCSLQLQNHPNAGSTNTMTSSCEKSGPLLFQSKDGMVRLKKTCIKTLQDIVKQFGL